MKRIFIPAILLVIISGFSFESNRNTNKLDSFKWMIGAWTVKTKQGSIMESWHLINDSTFAGESILVKYYGGTDILENLELVSRNSEVYYISKVNGQNNNQKVKFKITSFSDSKFVAENPEHDFPKRITYNLIAKDSMLAFIDGGPAMPEKKSEFHFSRYKN